MTYKDLDDLSYIKECLDYPVLKENLNDEQLLYINGILKEFNQYQNKYDAGEINVIDEYISKYGNSNIIEWYEGMKATESFLEDFNLEKGEYNEIM